MRRNAMRSKSCRLVIFWSVFGFGCGYPKGGQVALYKRGKTWWTDFSVNGQRYRQSLDTSDWREAQKQERKLIVQAESGKISQPGRALARLALSVAMER